MGNAEAVAGVEASFSNRTGTPFFVIDWRLVEVGGEWKLEEVLRAREGECGISGCVVDGPVAHLPKRKPRAPANRYSPRARASDNGRLN